MHARPPVLLLAACVTIAVAGCSGSSARATPTPTSAASTVPGTTVTTSTTVANGSSPATKAARAAYDNEYRELDAQRMALEDQIDTLNKQIAPLVPQVQPGAPHPASYDTLVTQLQDLEHELGDVEAAITALIAKGPGA